MQRSTNIYSEIAQTISLIIRKIEWKSADSCWRLTIEILFCQLPVCAIFDGYLSLIIDSECVVVGEMMSKVAHIHTQNLYTVTRKFLFNLVVGIGLVCAYFCNFGFWFWFVRLWQSAFCSFTFHMAKWEMKKRTTFATISSIADWGFIDNSIVKIVIKLANTSHIVWVGKLKYVRIECAIFLGKNAKLGM